MARNTKSNQEPPTEAKKPFPVLRFDQAGWCNEIGYSYSIGFYRPKDEREYKALRKYAAEELE